MVMTKLLERDTSSFDRDKEFSVQTQQTLPLYEQDFEQEKLQAYKIVKAHAHATIKDNHRANKSIGKYFVRTLGRIAGCGPFKDTFPLCSEKRFDKQLVEAIRKVQ